MNPTPGRTALLTVLAMVAFALNSLLCRAAIGNGLADPASFTSLRVFSGAVILVLLAWPRRGAHARGDWRMGAMLALYMVGFSFAYLALDAGVGALLLFGAVQLTMFAVALTTGERFTALGWLGLAVALGGLVVLLLPGAQAPDWRHAGLMVLAGIGWGIYSLLGRGAPDPLSSTAWNFVICLPVVLLVSVFQRESAHITTEGVMLAVASGVVASGLGYVTWYAALRGLTAGRAATVQLSVPVIAALGGVAWLGEALDARLVLAAALTLGGIALVFSQRSKA